MIVKLLTEHHLEFLSLKGGCTCSSESTHVKLPNCWTSHAMAHMSNFVMRFSYALDEYRQYTVCMDRCMSTMNKD